LLAFQAIFKKEHLRIGRSLLKNSIAELYEEEKHRNSPLYETYSQHFSSKNMVFRILKNSSFDFFNRLRSLSKRSEMTVHTLLSQ